MQQRIVIVVRATRRERIIEALRAAVGLTLRGASLEVVLAEKVPDGPDLERALAVLTAFGHRVSRHEDRIGVAVRGADVVEVWT